MTFSDKLRESTETAKQWFTDNLFNLAVAGSFAATVISIVNQTRTTNAQVASRKAYAARMKSHK